MLVYFEILLVNSEALCRDYIFTYSPMKKRKKNLTEEFLLRAVMKRKFTDVASAIGILEFRIIFASGHFKYYPFKISFGSRIHASHVD